MQTDNNNNNGKYNRLEDKMDKRFSSLYERIDELRSGVSEIKVSLAKREVVASELDEKIDDLKQSIDKKIEALRAENRADHLRTIKIIKLLAIAVAISLIIDINQALEFAQRLL